jgi:GntR family transcriptional regulator
MSRPPKLRDLEDAIDRQSFEPAYVQLANLLRRQIARGLFRPGDQLPSEAQLCRRYDVSPMTVRRSISLLCDQDVVSTAQGRGTFVKPLELGAANFDLRGLWDLFDGGTPTCVKLLDVRIAAADERTAARLSVARGQSVIYLRRLLLKNGQPVCYHRAYLVYDPRRPIVEAEMDVTSLQGLFTNADNDLLKFGELTIAATLMTEEESRILGVALPAAAFYLGHLFYDFEDRPLSWGWFIFRSDQLRFTTRVGLSIST